MTLKSGSKVRVEGQLLSDLIHRPLTVDGGEVDYYLVSIRGLSMPVAVLAVDVSPFETPKYQLTNVDFDASRSAIAKNIRLYRQKANLSQTDLAERIGVSQNAVSQWETDVCTPRFYMVPRLTKVLGISIEELYGANIQ